MPGSSTDLKLQQGDLTGDCFRLNRRFQLLEGRVSAIKTSAASPAATPSGTTTVISGGGGSGGGALAPIEVSLTADYTVAMPPAAVGATQVVKLIQDGTGGRSVSWPSNVKLAPVISAISTPALTAPHIVSCIAQFTLCADGNWWLSNTPILGRHA